MIFHASIPAREPRAAAEILARLLPGTVFPFPPFPGSFIVFSASGQGTALEVYPRGLVMEPGQHGVVAARAEPQRRSEVHLALGTPLSEAEIAAIAREAGWRSHLCTRGGLFGVVEVWVENDFMLELLTPQMQRDYLATATPEAWAKIFGFPTAPRASGT